MSGLLGGHAQRPASQHAAGTRFTTSSTQMRAFMRQTGYQHGVAPLPQTAATTNSLLSNSMGVPQRGQKRASVSVVARAATTETRAGQAATAPAAKRNEPILPRGNTAGAALILEDVTIQAGDIDILNEVSLQLMPGQRCGLVGANGCGKSTLLKCLTGHRLADSGRVLLSNGMDIGYLEQTSVSGSDLTVWDEARSRMTALVEAEAALEKASIAASEGHPKGAQMLEKAQEAFEAAGGYDADKRIANVLTGLGFRQDQYYKKCSEFSGGWQMRIGLARLLLGPAGQAAVGGKGGGFMFLDEPSNHLDSAAIRWLGNFLRTSGGGVLLISHDEDLLRTACDCIVEIRGKKIHYYAVGYDKFLLLREERMAQAQAEAAAQQEEIARLEEFVARFGAKASKASQAQSRMKQLEKLKKNAVEIPAASAAIGPGDARKVSLKLPRAPPCNQKVIQLKKAVVGWGSPADGGSPLLPNVDLTVEKGQRILVLGPNGAGKSTLLKSISGAIPLWGGERVLGDGVKLSVFSQDLAQDLPLGEQALEYVLEKARQEDPSITMERGRQSLGSLGLTGSMALRKIGELSGGEKARVALAAFALVPCNVLLLDEASNHLDAQTIEALTTALQDFNGAIIAITHNRAFATSLNATHILRVEGGQAKLSNNLGLTAADFEHSGFDKEDAKADSKADKKADVPAGGAGGKGKKGKGGAAAAPAAAAAAAPAAAAPATTASGNSKRKLSWKEQEEYGKLQKEMDRMNAEREALATKLGGLKDRKAIEEAGKKIAALDLEIEVKSERWMMLAELAGDL